MNTMQQQQVQQPQNGYPFISNGPRMYEQLSSSTAAANYLNHPQSSYAAAAAAAVAQQQQQQQQHQHHQSQHQHHHQQRPGSNCQYTQLPQVVGQQQQQAQNGVTSTSGKYSPLISFFKIIVLIHDYNQVEILLVLKY